ncbi:transposase [Ferrimicrobium acidiphilum]|uniref:transposase n=1 Tax=Ferrimicrobium acidiphilum TaxID=121039 RepID=UPI0023F02BC9|nr:transposase [Ferrimicrobium acidiphilum]
MGEAEGQKTRKEKTRRQFDNEFKKDAVRLFESGNSSLRQVAKDLGISKATLSN